MERVRGIGSHTRISKRHQNDEETVSSSVPPDVRHKRRDFESSRRTFRMGLLISLLFMATYLVFFLISTTSPQSNSSSPARETLASLHNAFRHNASEEFLFGVPVQQLASNIHRSFERFTSIDVDQALRRERGPPSYIYSENATTKPKHREDQVQTVKARFFVYCSRFDDYTRLAAVTAALTGIRLECIGYGWKRFSIINRWAPVLGLLMASENSSYFKNPIDQLNDEDVVTFADSDVVYSGDADVRSIVRAFASVTAHSAAEHQRMTTPDRREPRGSLRWKRYARDVRTGGALAPFVIQGDTYCYLQGLGSPGDCNKHFKLIEDLHACFLKQQKHFLKRNISEDASGESTRHNEEPVPGYGKHSLLSEEKTEMLRVSSGFFLARVWALRRVLLAAQNLAHTLPNCLQGRCRYPIPRSPRHKMGAHRMDGNDQSFLGIAYLLNRLHEYQTGGPLAVEYEATSGKAGAVAVLSVKEREKARWANTMYDLLNYTSYIPSGAPDTDGASLRMPHAIMMVDAHNLLVQVLHEWNAWSDDHDTYIINASWPPELHHARLRQNAFDSHDSAMAERFEHRRQLTLNSASSVGPGMPFDVSPLLRSPLGNVLNEKVVVLNPKKHTFACRAEEARTTGRCSGLTFLRSLSLITADSPTYFPPENDAVGTRPLAWHFAGLEKRSITFHYLYLLPQLYPLLHPRANRKQAEHELSQLTELLPPMRLWRVGGECGDVDAYRGGEGTGRAVTENLIRKSTRELGCLPAADPVLMPLRDSGKEIVWYWAAPERR